MAIDPKVAQDAEAAAARVSAIRERAKDPKVIALIKERFDQRNNPPKEEESLNAQAKSQVNVQAKSQANQVKTQAKKK